MDEKRDAIDAGEAERALAALADTRRRMASRVHWSFQRHLAFGLMMGLLVASFAFPPPAMTAIAVLVVTGTGLIVARDRRRDGFFVNGYRAGRTRRITFLYLALLIPLMSLGVVGKVVYALPWAPFAAAAVAVLLGTWSSKAWERAYRADLAERP